MQKILNRLDINSVLHSFVNDIGHLFSADLL